MRILFVLSVVAILFAGCSSNANTTTTLATGNRNGSDARNSNTVVPSDPNRPADPGTESANVKLTPTKAERADKLRQKNLAAAPTSGPPALPQFRPAPENSQIATSMNGEGAVIETRVFKNHPQLAKVEMTWAGPQDKSFKIFLRNGKVIEAKSDKINDLKDVPTSILLEMAGIGAGK